MISATLTSVNATEKELTIYNSTLGEILERFVPEEYDNLSNESKIMYETTRAYNVLAEDDTLLNLPVAKSARSVIWKPYAIVLTKAVYTRINSAKINYGGTYSCTKSVRMFGSAYLIRSGEGKILDVTTASSPQTTGISSKKNYNLTSSSSKYYVRAFGEYIDNDNGATVRTSQQTGSRN